MHMRRVGALNKIGLPSITFEKAFKLPAADPCKDSRIGYLVTVEVKDGKHSTVANGIEEFISVPGGRKRACLGLAVAYDASDDKIGVVKGGAGSMGHRIPQFPPLVDRAGRLCSSMTRDATGERELFEELPHAFFIL